MKYYPALNILKSMTRYEICFLQFTIHTISSCEFTLVEDNVLQLKMD